MSALYTAEATAWGGREGRASSSDGSLDVTLTVPRELGGPGGDGTNPEELFAAGFAGCFHSALLLAARGRKIDIEGSAVTARVGLGPMESGVGFGVSLVELHVEIPDLDKGTADELVETAHEWCPYSNATRGNVDVKLEVTTDSD